MGPVRVVTDGGADLPSDVADRLGIRVVPGPVRFGERVFDGDAAAFWRELRGAATIPSTAPPGVAALTDAFAGDRPVCAIHVSAELGQTEEHARAAAAAVANPVHVVDSRSLSVGTALVAMVAAQAAAVDVDHDELQRVARSLVERVHVHAVIEAVDYLLRGGRAGLLDAASARHGARQLIAVKGHAIPMRRVKDRRRAVGELLDHIAHNHLGHGVQQWAVAHGDAADVDDFVQSAEKLFGTPPSFVTLLGPPVGTHAGPDALVLGLLTRP
jgi:DegV family protein with EDD domain